MCTRARVHLAIPARSNLDSMRINNVPKRSFIKIKPYCNRASVNFTIMSYVPGKSFIDFLRLKESVTSMMRGSSLLLEGESHQLFCRVFLDETLSHFCWEDDDLRSTALPLEFVHDIIVIGGDENSDEDSENTPLPIFALVLSNEQVLKVTCPNASEFQLWFHGLQRLLALSHNVDEADVTHGQSPARNGSNGRSDSNRGGPDYDDEDAAALAPYDYAEDHEEYGDGHAVSNTFSPSASLRSNVAREDHEAEVRLRQQMFSVEQRLAEAEAALRVFDANGGSSKTSGQYSSYNDDTPPAPSQSPSYKKFQPQKLAVESHNADAGTGKFYDESESVDTDMYASSASKDDENWRGQDDAESTSGYTSTSHDSVTQAESQLSAMQNSILLLCDQVQDLRGKLNSSRPSSSKKSKFDELARAKRELMRMREENEALAARCHELSLMQSPHRQSDKQQERDLENLKDEVHRLNGMLQTAVSVNARRQAEVQAFKESVTRLLIEKGVVDGDKAL